jgi:hypothetical protein
MRKLRLNIEELRVESFAVSPEGAPDGTVHGQLYNDPQPTDLSCIDCEGAPSVGTCIGPTYCCPATWKQTCAATCFYTECGHSCWTWWCNSCASCPNTCGAGGSCADEGCTSV